MLNVKNLLAFASVTSLAFAICPTAALAQEATAPVPEVEAAAATAEPVEDQQGDQIVITAQKRAENVQDVPISVAAFSGETLDKSNVDDHRATGQGRSAISRRPRARRSSFMRVNIRGIGAAGNTTIEPSVAIFLDGAYVPRAGAVVSSMLDIESVEVLRGPQGTLFGRNASVGALSLHTARPKFGDLDG